MDCKAPFLCATCLSGFVKINDTLCEKIQYIEPVLYSTEIPEIIGLNFNVPSRALIENIHKQAQRIFLFTITPNPGIGFSFKTEIATETDLLIAMKFNSDIPSGTKIKINIAKQDWMTSGLSTQLAKFSYEMKTNQTIYKCDPNFRFDQGNIFVIFFNIIIIISFQFLYIKQ